MSDTHLFFAIVPDAATRDALSGEIARGRLTDVRWATPDEYHLRVFSLAEQPAEREAIFIAHAEAAVEQFRRIPLTTDNGPRRQRFPPNEPTSRLFVRQRRPWRVRWRSVGALPSMTRPRALCVERWLDGNDDLLLLGQMLEAACRPLLGHHDAIPRMRRLASDNVVLARCHPRAGGGLFIPVPIPRLRAGREIVGPPAPVEFSRPNDHHRDWSIVMAWLATCRAAVHGLPEWRPTAIHLLRTSSSQERVEEGKPRYNIVHTFAL